jgi:hypothetical protein
MLVLMQMTFLNNVRKVDRLVLSRTSCSFLWNPTVNHSVYKRPSLDYILNQLNPVQNFNPYFCNTGLHFNINLPYCPTLPKWYLLFSLSIQNFVCISNFSIVPRALTTL